MVERKKFCKEKAGPGVPILSEGRPTKCRRVSQNFQILHSRGVPEKRRMGSNFMTRRKKVCISTTVDTSDHFRRRNRFAGRTFTQTPSVRARRGARILCLLSRTWKKLVLGKKADATRFTGMPPNSYMRAAKQIDLSGVKVSKKRI